nr:unnamed protein product [Callosobruchus analis]
MSEDVYLELLQLVTLIIKKQDINMKEALAPYERPNARSIRFFATGKTFIPWKISPLKSTYDFTYGQEIIDRLNETDVFYSTIREALLILITMPCTTTTVDTLRRVKTWLRTTGEQRLTELCLLNYHRDLVKTNHEQHIAERQTIGQTDSEVL